MLIVFMWLGCRLGAPAADALICPEIGRELRVSDADLCPTTERVTLEVDLDRGRVVSWEARSDDPATETCWRGRLDDTLTAGVVKGTMSGKCSWSIEDSHVRAGVDLDVKL